MRRKQHTQYILYSTMIFVILQMLATFIICAAEEIEMTTLNLEYKALYITCCDIDGNKLKDIVAADEYNITIFRQKPNFSFQAYSTKSKEKIVALNSGKLNKSNKESIICLGKNRIFYFSWNNDEIKGPIYLNVQPDENLPLVEKQGNLKNISFMVDLDNNGLDDIIIPSNRGPLIIWQTEPLVFKSYILSIERSFENITANIRPWPKSAKKVEGFTKGISFFPTFSKELFYWVQDYNNDKLLDIIALINSSDGYIMSVYLQNTNNAFEKPKEISLQSINKQQLNSEFRLLDWDNDGVHELIETSIEYPLRGNISLLPLLNIKIYKAMDPYKFMMRPERLYKTSFIPGLDSIIDLNNDGFYEIINIPPPLKLGSKESVIKMATSKRITFALNYLEIDKTKNNKNKIINLGKDFSIEFPGFKDVENFRQFIKFEDIDSDGIYDILLLKKITQLEINTLKKKKDTLFIDRTIEISLPYVMSEIHSIDINSDKKREFLMLDSTGKKINIIYLNSL